MRVLFRWDRCLGHEWQVGRRLWETPEQAYAWLQSQRDLASDPRMVLTAVVEQGPANQTDADEPL